MVELRKRAAPPPPPVRPAKKAATGDKPVGGAKRGRKPKNPAPADEEPEKKEEETAAPEKKEEVDGETAEKIADADGPKGGADEGSKATSKTPAVGDKVDLGSFGGEVENQEGKKVTLKQLIDESKAGVVLFTYPKANTPGCTKQACAFRDGHATLSGGGLTIYGLSGDSPKSNTTFKTKQNLNYDLLCDPKYTLINAIGMQAGSAKTTKRGVFAVDKEGKVLLSFQGGPIPTVDEVKKLVDSLAK